MSEQNSSWLYRSEDASDLCVIQVRKSAMVLAFFAKKGSRFFQLTQGMNKNAFTPVFTEEDEPELLAVESITSELVPYLKSVIKSTKLIILRSHTPEHDSIRKKGL